MSFEMIADIVHITVLPAILVVMWRIKTNDLHELDKKIARIMEKLGMNDDGS